MLLVRTQLRRSLIHGIGLFAAQDIAKGTLVQRFMKELDLVLSYNHIQVLPDVVKDHLLTYAYRHKKTNMYILCGDNARFLNHSSEPNLVADGSEDENDVAARNIVAGEELTVNYQNFDADFDYKMRRV